jgi:hypothetical protein
MIHGDKTNPVGLDIFVKMLQHQEEDELPTLFGVSSSACLFYGRGEIITINGEPVKVVFKSGKDYTPIEYDGNYSFKSYLMTDGLFKPDELQERVNVSLYCHGDLTKLFPTITHRADEETRKVMLDFVYRMIEPRDMESIEIIQEMQPYHSFKINFTVV